VSATQVGQVVFGASGLAVLAYEAYIWSRIVRARRREDRRSGDAERVTVAAVRGKYLVLGAALTAIGAVGRVAVTASLVATAVAFLASPLIIWWVARSRRQESPD
jgi:hypothetical protein